MRSTVVGVALPDLGAAAGVSTDTARAAVRRLQGAGWSKVVATETALTTRTYELRVPPGMNPGAADVPDGGPLADLGADIARWGALGRATARVARTLAGAPGGLLVTQVARLLSMSPASVRYHLRKLEQVGWLRRARGRVSAEVTSQQVRDLTRDLGVAGARDRQLAAVALARQVRAAARALLRGLRPRRAAVSCPALSAAPRTGASPPAA